MPPHNIIWRVMTALRVMVVDDSEVVCRAVCGLLRSYAELQVVRIVADGLEAVECAQRERPDVILLDISLPSLNGIEAARRIHRVSPDSKILFLSQYDSRAGAREALNTGAAGYVVKSDAAYDLVAGIRAVCQGRPFMSSSLH